MLQSVQLLEPELLLEKDPGAQRVHWSGEVAPCNTENVPALQGRQKAWLLLAPLEGKYVPALQSVHVLDPSDSEKDPAAHNEQTVLLVAPKAEEKEPGLQLVQAVAPERASEYVPAVHKLQEVLIDWAPEKVPGRQGSQEKYSSST